jgi:hypothetical protein
VFQKTNKCGCGEDKRYLLLAHHINGNHNDNNSDNLELTCFNCHAKRHLRQTETGWVVDYSALTPRHLLSTL